MTVRMASTPKTPREPDEAPRPAAGPARTSGPALLTRLKRLLQLDAARGTLPVLAAAPVVSLMVLVWSANARDLLSTAGWVAAVLPVYAVYAALFAAATHWAFARLEGQELREAVLRGRPGHEGATRLRRFIDLTLTGGGALSWGIGLGMIALLCALVLAATPSLRSDPVMLQLGLAVILTAATGMVATYAVEYARIDADAEAAGEPVPFGFAGERERCWADYLYLSVMVQSTYGGSDVTVGSRRARTAVASHGALAFLFNAFILSGFVAILIA